MKSIKRCLKMISPFNNMEEMPTPVYAGKKILAFFLIFILSIIVSQAVMVGGLIIAGYNPPQGIMPSENIQTVISYYGYLVYAAITILYCKAVEKRSMKSIGFNRKGFDHVIGAVIAVVLLTVIAVICCISGGISFTGINHNIDVVYLIALFGGFLVQGAAEEIMCRGFLMPALLKKMSAPCAVFISATVFALPHLTSMTGSDTPLVLVGIVNLYLVSIIFSLLVLRRSNIWASCGLHSIWNFMLNGVLGLTVSGNQAETTGVFGFAVNHSGLLNGGSYGLESSIITTVVLAAAIAVLYNVKPSWPVDAK